MASIKVVLESSETSSRFRLRGGSPVDDRNTNNSAGVNKFFARVDRNSSEHAAQQARVRAREAAER
jgi:hypothetical protein